jgi:hypothetical protein
VLVKLAILQPLFLAQILRFKPDLTEILFAEERIRELQKD